MFNAVHDVPRHAHHVFRPCATGFQHCNDIAQGLAGLGNKVIAFKFLRCISQSGRLQK